MGQKQIEGTNIIKFIPTILCPNCFSSIPYFDIFIENLTIKIKIHCKCKNQNIMLLNEYSNELKNISLDKINCINHNNQNAIFFCINCEKWLCEKCYNEHNENICVKNQTNDNSLISTCKIHIKNEDCFYCKQCKNFLCKECSIGHNVKYIKEHEIIKWNDYLTNQKVGQKITNFSIYKSETDVLNKKQIEMFLEKLKNKKGENNDDYIKLNQLYQSNIEINEQLLILVNLLFDTIKNNHIKIKNKKFIINIINNIKFNFSQIKIDENYNDTSINEIKSFLKTNFMIMKLKSTCNNLTKIQNSNSVYFLYLLPNNKFAAIYNDSSIKIYNGNKNEIEFNLIGHTNKITSVILLKDKETLVSVSNDLNIILWNIINGTQIKSIFISSTPRFVYQSYNENNQLIILSFGNVIDIWNIDSSNKISSIILKEYDWFESFYQLKNNQNYLLGKKGGFLIYNNNFEFIKEIKIYQQIPFYFLELNNNNIVVSMRENHIFIYDRDYNFKRRIIAHLKDITGIIEYDNNILISCSSDSTFKLWNLNNSELNQIFEVNIYPINSIIKLQNGNLVSSSKNPKFPIEIWNIEIYE